MNDPQAAKIPNGQTAAMAPARCRPDGDQDDIFEILAENDHLKEMMADLAPLKSRNLSLLQEIGRLRDLLDRAGDDASSRADPDPNPVVASPAKAGAQCAAVKAADVIILATQEIEERAWRLFHQPAVVDLLYGLPSGTAALIVAAQPQRVLDSELGYLTTLYNVQYIAWSAICPEVGAEPSPVELSALAARVAPKIVFVIDGLVRSDLFVRAMASCGARTVLWQLTASQQAKGSLTGQAGRSGSGAYDAYDAVLVSSRAEQSAVRSEAPNAAQVMIYSRGVNMAVFTASVKSSGRKRTVLYVEDRSDARSLQAVVSAAKALEDRNEFHFIIYGASARNDTVNSTWRPFPTRSRRREIYDYVDATIIPLSCSGFSQTFMESMASGCYCLVPRAHFRDLLATETCAIGYDADTLASSVEGLYNADPLVLSRDACEFARRTLTRSAWKDELRRTLCTLAPAAVPV